MPASNKYFDMPAPRPEHPRVRAWRSYRRDPQVHHVGVEILRDREGLTPLPARIFVFFYREDGEVARQDEAPWELELEDWLIGEENALAVSIENEKLRFSLLLKPALRPILVRYGDGYFNAVLIAALRAGPFGQNAEVADMLRSIHEDQPAGGSRQDCEQMIDHELGVAARKILSLYTERAVAEEILAGAIAHYLDDRFSVSNSRALGLL